jgi:hypothetical protein
MVKSLDVVLLKNKSMNKNERVKKQTIVVSNAISISDLKTKFLMRTFSAVHNTVGNSLKKKEVRMLVTKLNLKIHKK